VLKSHERDQFSLSDSFEMTTCFFVSDLHGHIERYQKLYCAVLEEKPAAVFLGGDLLPAEIGSFLSGTPRVGGFLREVMEAGFAELKEKLGGTYPQVFLILGNDDPRIEESEVIHGEARGLWEYVSNRNAALGEFLIRGYAYVPPTPFLLKDWERYDVSRFVDPGCVAPEAGWRSVPAAANEVKFATIQTDLEELAGKDDLSKAIFLFHAPPYQTVLDRAALDGQTVDGVPINVHVGSLAIRKFIESRQPLITLHGHIHESPTLTGSWRDRIGRTWMFSAAHDGHELALVRFDPRAPERASRELI
jgi:Icc-related predicted phosphoesterase